MDYQPATKSKQKELSMTPSSSRRQTSLNHVAVHPLLEIQQTVSNQAGSNLPHSGNVQTDPARQLLIEPRFGHDFSQVPVHSSRPPVLQTKLRINQPGDAYEQEADQVSEEVMRMTDSENSVLDDESGAKKSLMRKQSAELSTNTAMKSSDVPSVVYDVLNGGGGQPLDTVTRAFMEPRFGYDFSRVRVHRDEQAAESAQAINARAYTVGRDVVFGAGQYALGTSEVRRLLAHELTHVLQNEVGSRTHFVRNITERKIITQPEQSSISRRPDISPAPLVVRRAFEDIVPGIHDAFEFRIGLELDRSFVEKARDLLATDGNISDTDLLALREFALKQKETVNDFERMFMAGLLARENIDKLQKLQIKTGASISFKLPSIRQHLGHVINLDRQQRPTTVPKSALAATIQSEVGSFNAEDLIRFSQDHHVSLRDVLQAMKAAASDVSPADKLMAGFVFAVARSYIAPTADEVLKGHVKVDGLSSQAFERLPFITRPNSQSKVIAFYMPVPDEDSGLKGNTLYVRTDFSIDNLSHRSTIIHELSHREEYAILSTGKDRPPTSHQYLEFTAFLLQAQYILDEIVAQKTPKEMKKNISQIASESDPIIQLALLAVAAKGKNKARFQPFVKEILEEEKGEAHDIIWFLFQPVIERITKVFKSITIENLLALPENQLLDLLNEQIEKVYKKRDPKLTTQQALSKPHESLAD